MSVYVGIGPNDGMVIRRDEEAFHRAIKSAGLEPIAGWENVAPWFTEKYQEALLEDTYSGNWTIYNSEEEYEQAKKLTSESPELLPVFSNIFSDFGLGSVKL